MKQEDIKILIVIPVFNHKNTIREVVKGVLKRHKEVLVIDDGSSEDIYREIKDLKILFLKNEKNQGKGSSIKKASLYALEKGYSHIITLDGDGQHLPKDLPIFLKLIKQKKNNIILGKRNFPVTAPKLSKFGRAFSNFWFKVQTGEKIGDMQSGFRAYPLFIFNFFKFKENRYAFEVEVLVKSTWAGVKISELDISVYYPKKGSRISHFNLFLDNFRLTMLNTKLTFLSMLPVFHKKIFYNKKEKISFIKPLKTIKQLLKKKIPPSIIAFSTALGIFLGGLPLIGLHSITILLAARYFRLNGIVALSASQLCMPPFVPALCIETAYYLKHGYFLTEVSLKTLGYEASIRFTEWFLGSLLIAPILAFIIASIVYLMTILFQNSKHNF